LGAQRDKRGGWEGLERNGVNEGELPRDRKAGKENLKSGNAETKEEKKTKD